jgi:hypothetical protein
MNCDAYHGCTGGLEERFGSNGHHWATRPFRCPAETRNPFLLPGFDKPQPAGDYRVDHDVESIEGISRLAWLRVGSFIHLPGIGVHMSMHQMVPINPADLDAALEKDNKTS